MVQSIITVFKEPCYGSFASPDTPHTHTIHCWVDLLDTYESPAVWHKSKKRKGQGGLIHPSSLLAALPTACPSITTSLFTILLPTLLWSDKASTENWVVTTPIPRNWALQTGQMSHPSCGLDLEIVEGPIVAVGLDTVVIVLSLYNCKSCRCFCGWLVLLWLFLQCCDMELFKQ